MSAKPQLARRLRLDGRSLIAESDMCRADLEWRRPVGIAEHNSQAISSKAHMDDLSQRLMVEVHRRGGKRRRLRSGRRLVGNCALHHGRGPAANPVLFGPKTLRH